MAPSPGNWIEVLSSGVLLPYERTAAELDDSSSLFLRLDLQHEPLPTPEANPVTRYGGERAMDEPQAFHAVARVDRPTEAVTLERADSFANEAMFTVALQLRRVASDEPEDEKFVTRRWADWQFLIVALRRLQRAAALATTTPTGARLVGPALAQFRQELPHLKTMRNIAEHFDSYAVDSPDRHDPRIDRRQLQVGQFSDKQFVWLKSNDGLPLTLDAAHVKTTAEALYVAVRDAYRTLPPARLRS